MHGRVHNDCLYVQVYLHTIMKLYDPKVVAKQINILLRIIERSIRRRCSDPTTMVASIVL